MDDDMSRRVVAEFFGTFWLVLGGCGAAVLAYGDKIKTDPAFETAKLSEALRTFRAEVKKRHGLDSELGIMGLNGAVEIVT